MAELEQSIIVKNLDHLGIVAGIIDELGLVESVDSVIPSEGKVSIGTMLKALILNSMGFSQHALYITPSFFEPCPVEHLCERKLRMALEQSNQTVDNQIGKAVSKPTLRMVFNLFRAIHLVLNTQNQQTFPFCTNLSDNHKKIIRLLGPPIAKYYFLRI